MSTLPPRVWAALFAGAHFRPFQQDFLITTDEIARALGVSPKDVAKLRGCVDGNFDSLHDSVLGLSWHENYLSAGPSIQALDDAWTRLWGKPWVHLTDDMWNEIPPELFRRVDAAFHGLIGTHDEHRSWKMDQVLPVYLHLAQLLDPGSQVAVNLAQRIVDLRTCDVDEHRYPCVSAVHDGELDSLISYLKAGNPIVGIKRDPLISAPETVADVAQTLRLSENAARYFLQLLALTRPMDKNIKAWNGWTKKQLDQAREELLEKKLVVTAKRAGTGRNVFLPGGWLEKSDTGPAMEMWKAPHYLLWDDTQCRPIVDTCPPILPYPNLFAEVWERYKSGDTPGYEKLTTKRYRSRR